MRILGAIIAGGHSTRMGGREKSFLELAGASLLERTLSRLRFQVDDVVINANGDASRFSAAGVVVVEDVLTNVGTPLSGLHAALYYGASKGFDAVVTVPSDAPFLPLDLVERLLEAGEVKPGDPSVVDFISLINPVTDAWYGECRKEIDVLLLDKDDIATRVQMNHKVQEEYLLVAAVERIAGTDGIQFGLVIGGNLVIFCRLPPVLLRRIRARQRKGDRQQSHHVTRSASGQ